MPVCRDGWQRVGYFAVHAPTAAEVAATVDDVLRTVAFDVEAAVPATRDGAG